MSVGNRTAVFECYPRGYAATLLINTFWLSVIPNFRRTWHYKLFGPSPLGTMASADFLRLTFFNYGLSAVSARPPEVRHHSFLFNLPDLLHGVTLIFWTLACVAALSVRTALVSGSCSSGQDFAIPFLQLTHHYAHLGVRYAVGYEYPRCGLSPLKTGAMLGTLQKALAQARAKNFLLTYHSIIFQARY